MQARCQITVVTAATDRLIQALAEKKMSQEALASAVGYKSQGTIANAVARGSLPKKLYEIAAVLGVRPEWIKTGAMPKEAGAPATAGPAAPDVLAAAHTELIGYFDVLSPYEQAAILKDVRARAARALGDRLLAEKFGVKGYVNDDSLPDVYKQFERRRERRGVDQAQVPSPLALRPTEGDTGAEEQA
jgi:hypothetical protein